ncbi:MAG TPA: response regulator transcription factor [Mesorhizobium sp.]|jgi:two-component system OmpR family response regulator
MTNVFSKRPVVALVGVADQTVAELSTYLSRVGFDLRATMLHWGGALPSLPSDAAIVVLGDRLTSTEVGRVLRQYASGPVLFLVVSRPVPLVERVLMLEAGAADVVESPLHPRELAARIGGLAGRLGIGARETLVLERSTVDLKAALVMTRGNEEEQLSSGQLALLRLFIANPHKVLTREDIMTEAPAEREDAFDRSIDSRIVRLRRKLDTDSITTIRGTGYRFDPPFP